MVDLIDTNGVKPTLKKGVLGYDDYSVGGDAGRLYVGTGTASIAQAKKSEVDAKVSLVTSTDNAIARFDLTSGQIQNSGVFIDDNSNIGVAISSPQARFHSKGGADSHAGIFETTTTLSLLSFADTGTSSYDRVKIGSSGNDFVAYTTNTERMRIDSSGNLLLTSGTGGLGYGAGAGGTVTQLTSKSTNVTLNKPSGQITMNNAALAAGASVYFTVQNSLVAGSDNINTIGVYATVNPANYKIEPCAIYTGNFQIRVTNITGGSLAEALIIEYTVIKGAVA